MSRDPVRGNSGKRLLPLLPVVLLLMGFAVYEVFPTATNQGYQPDQPIPYSHKLHAGQYKIDCKYCHVNAERSNHATVPSLNICMNCHRVVKTESPWIQQITQAYNEGKPIEWVRIHELPDHANFSHKRHVKKGIACQTCHGPIQEMEKVYQYAPLTMGWCMDCHRGVTTPKNILQTLPAGTPADERNRVHVAPTDCSTCHK